MLIKFLTVLSCKMLGIYFCLSSEKNLHLAICVFLIRCGQIVVCLFCVCVPLFPRHVGLTGQADVLEIEEHIHKKDVQQFVHLQAYTLRQSPKKHPYDETCSQLHPDRTHWFKTIKIFFVSIFFHNTRTLRKIADMTS